jgi:hypothetical protein
MKTTVSMLMMMAVVGLVPMRSAHAIKYGEPDTDHPYVGLMVALDEDGNPLWRCSGTLICPTLFLTAGHCTEPPADSVEIWFDADVGSGIPENGYPYTGDVSGTPYTHPDYDPDAFYLHDLGVVVLDEPVYMEEYGELPEEGMLDELATERGRQDVTFTVVGYGLQDTTPVVQADLVRMVAVLRLVQLGNGLVGRFAMMLTSNAHTGGTCFGDSGGPVFYDATNVIVGITSFVLNSNCAGLGGMYRIDQADDLNWLYEEFGECLG